MLSVELRHSGKEGKICRVHNLAPEGMLLENNLSLLSIGSAVDLLVSRNDRTWAMPAIVTHCNSTCIGVMFSQRQSAFYRAVTQPPGNIEKTTSARNSGVPKPC